MDLEPVISQDILLLSPPCKQMCVAQGPEDKLQCVYWYSQHLQRSGAFCSLFFSTSSPSPSPSPALLCCWWRDDETRREPLTVEQRSSRPRMRAGCPENAAGAAPLLGARTRAQSRDTRTRQQRRAGRGAGRYAVPGNRRVSAFRVKHYWVQFSEAARRYVAGSPHRSWAGGDHTVSCTSLQL